MKLTKASLLHFLLYCATTTLGVEIQSDPAPHTEGFLQTELEKTVSLTCRSKGGSGAQPEEELVWKRNGALVKLMDDNTMGRSSVCVTPVTREDHTAIFTCHLKGNASVNSSVTLNVTYAPMLSGEEEVAVEEEEVLVLQCDVRANPVVAVSWQQEGSLLDPSKGGFTLTNDGVTTQLTANRANRRLHQGTYRCTTVSSKYGTSSKLFQVTVNEKTLKFPLMPLVAGLVVVVCTTLLAIIARWKKIAKCCK